MGSCSVVSVSVVKLEKARKCLLQKSLVARSGSSDLCGKKAGVRSGGLGGEGDSFHVLCGGNTGID